MIDKLDLRIPNNAHFRRDILTVFSWDPTRLKRSPLKRAFHYQARVDFRSLGMDAFLHFKCQHGDHHSKLEILDVGKKGYIEIAEIIDRLAPLDAGSLGIMRMDLTADVSDVPVCWFKDHARFKFKRTDQEYGKIQYRLIGRGEIETVQAGNRPNLYRIYNKTRECQFQFSRMQKGSNRDADPIDFEQAFGLKETDVITRVERQCGGRGIPSEISTFADLHKLAEFDPFTALEITSSQTAVLPSPEDFPGLNYYTGLGLHCESQRIGMHGLRKQLNKQTRWNAARTLRDYSAFFPSAVSISTPDIVRAYRESTAAQLAA